MKYTIEIRETEAVVRKGRPVVHVARVLGSRKSDGIERVWLDRLLFEPGDEVEGWEFSGAISTILERGIAS